MSRLKPATCTSCAAPIVFVWREGARPHPVERTPYLTIIVTKRAVCPACDGTCGRNGKCKRCDGTGKLKLRTVLTDAGEFRTGYELAQGEETVGRETATGRESHFAHCPNGEKHRPAKTVQR